MSRSIVISYVDAAGKETDIEIPPPYYLLGAQHSSLKFWSIPRLKEVGIERLTILGETDPVNFWGWEDIALLEKEITLLAKHLESVDFYPSKKAEWLSHLTFCYHLLIALTPKDCTPRLEIG